MLREVENKNNVMSNNKERINKVSVMTVVLFTLAMTTATGLGAMIFFFVELDPLQVLIYSLFFYFFRDAFLLGDFQI